MSYSTKDKIPAAERIDMARKRIEALENGAGAYSHNQRYDEIARAESVIQIAHEEMRAAA